jgi:hypothetical protein
LPFDKLKFDELPFDDLPFDNLPFDEYALYQLILVKTGLLISERLMENAKKHQKSRFHSLPTVLLFVHLKLEKWALNPGLNLNFVLPPFQFPLLQLRKSLKLTWEFPASLRDSILFAFQRGPIHQVPILPKVTNSSNYKYL